MPRTTASFPWFAFYHRDFLASTEGWTPAERWHYLRLLIHQWEHGAVPLELDRLALISPGIQDAWAVVAPKFPGGRNPRMAELVDESEAIHSTRSAAASTAAKARWGRRKGAAGEHAPRNAARNASPDAPAPGSVQLELGEPPPGSAMAVFDAPRNAAGNAPRIASSMHTHTHMSGNGTHTHPSANGHGKNGNGHRLGGLTLNRIGGLGELGRAGAGTLELDRPAARADQAAAQVPEPPDVTAARNRLAQGVAKHVLNPRARLQCLAWVQALPAHKLRAAETDLRQAERCESPGGILVARWTRGGGSRRA